MADKLKFEVKGFKELNDKLLSLSDDLNRKVLQKAVSSVLREFARELKTIAPTHEAGNISQYSKQYGSLKKNIRAGKAKAKKTGKGAFVGTGNAFWGFFLEHGTRKMAAKPWFKPLWDSKINKMLEAVKEKIRIGLENEEKK